MPRIVFSDPLAPSEDAIREAASVLKAGKLVAFPTETVYGLGANALDASAILRIFETKGRPNHHPLIVHVCDADEARELADGWSDAADRLARRFWPGPLTLIVRRGRKVPGAVSGGLPTLAIRAPSHPIARALIGALGAPIAAPSANRYQSISPTSAEHVARSLGNRVDLIVDGGPCPFGIESTVVDVTGATPVVLRPGAVSMNAILEVIHATRGTTTAKEDAARPSPGMDARHYAPKATLHVVARDAIADFCRQQTGRSVAIIAIGSEVPDVTPRVHTTLPNSAEGYARELFATLHRLDALQVDIIVVETPPDDDAWWAVRDRLERAQF